MKLLTFLKTQWIRFKIIRGFWVLVRHPERTDLIIKALRELQKLPDQTVINTLLSEIYGHDKFKTMRAQNYMPPKPRLDELRAMPEGSFGRAVADHLDRNGINFDTFPDYQGGNDLEYINHRMYLDHDLWHVLLDASTQVEDELALQAFNVGQLRTPFGALIIAGGLLHLLAKNPISAADTIGKIAQGFQLGKNARFLLEMPLHEMFTMPLELVRREARIYSLGHAPT